MASLRINITVPSQLLAQIDAAAKAEQRSRSGLLREAARQYLAMGTWERYQRMAADRARRLGVRTEEDVERLIEELRAERRKA